MEKKNDIYICVCLFSPVDQRFAIRVVILEQDFEHQSSCILNALFYLNFQL